MKLPNFLENNAFNNLRKRVGAPLSFYKLTVTLPAPVFKAREVIKITPVALPLEGLDVEFGQISTHSDGTLVYDGRRVLIHIRDVANIGGRKHVPRFHVANCRTLIEMKSSGRFERYVVSEREDGNFHIRYDSGPLRITKLDVCQNCLDKLSWNGFYSDMSKNSRMQIVSAFLPKFFFDKYPKSLHPVIPTFTSITAPTNEYPQNWEDISRELKKQLRYRCQEQGCSIQLSASDSKFLHVHHKNSLKNDCRPENLICLCIRCHANQPNHSHMKSLPEYSEFTNNFL